MASAMDKTAKYDYIFRGNALYEQGRFSLIERQLADNSKLLDCIEHYFIKDQTTDHLGKYLKNDGHLSVPTLVCSLMEFVSSLYVGRTKYSGDCDCANFIKEFFPAVSNDESSFLYTKFKREFGDVYKEHVCEAFIKDYFPSAYRESLLMACDKYRERHGGEAGRTVKHFIESGLVSNYKNYESLLHLSYQKFKERHGYDASKNVKEFIDKFFPVKYKRLALLLWNAMSDGLVYELSSSPLTYHQDFQHYRIRVQFYVEDEENPGSRSTKPMSIDKSDDTIIININDFELVDVLKKAIEKYRKKLAGDEKLQDRFIRAWSTIDEYSKEIQPDSVMGREVKSLLNDLREG